jgi:hypothetical protein
MGGLVVLGAVIVALVVFDIIALSRGTDTRPGFSTDRASGAIRTI